MTETHESPAGAIRRAAARLRELAQAATPAPWQHMCLGSEGCLVLREHGTIRERGHGRVARFGQKDWKADHADAEFVASMSPLVASALAGWLDVYAERFADWTGPHISAELGAALNVARTILGEAIP